MTEFEFSGVFEQQLISGWRSDLKNRLEAASRSRNFTRRVLSIFVELAQNIQRYSFSKGEGSLRILEDDSRIILRSENEIALEAYSGMKEMLEQVSGISRNELSKQIRVRRQGEPTRRGGGLGLMEIARMSDIGLQWELEVGTDRYMVVLTAEVREGARVKDLNIERKRDSLGVRCRSESGRIELGGVSYPEDAFSFFEPISTWVESFLATNPASLEIVCAIEYLNSSSSKCLFDLFDSIAKRAPETCAVLVIWRHDPNDEDTRKVGEEFAEDVEIPFVFEPAG